MIVIEVSVRCPITLLESVNEFTFKDRSNNVATIVSSLMGTSILGENK